MSVAIEALGEDGVLLRLGDGIDAACNARVHAVAARINASRPPWLREIVPAFASLAVFVDLDALAGGQAPLADVEAWLGQRCAEAAGTAAPAPRSIEVPVRFGGSDGPDLAAVAKATGLGEDEVLSRFCAPAYQVAMLGFAPGFPYLIGLDPALAVPRLETPRTHVPAGSVGIGGAQAGIYPVAGPGGWRLLGRAQCRLFDPSRESPALLVPGNHVRFVPAQ